MALHGIWEKFVLFLKLYAKNESYQTSKIITALYNCKLSTNSLVMITQFLLMSV